MDYDQRQTFEALDAFNALSVAELLELDPASLTANQRAALSGLIGREIREWTADMLAVRDDLTLPARVRERANEALIFLDESRLRRRDIERLLADAAAAALGAQTSEAVILDD